MKTEKLKLATCTSIEQIFSQTIDVPGCRCCCCCCRSRGQGCGKGAGPIGRQAGYERGFEQTRLANAARHPSKNNQTSCACSDCVCVGWCVCVVSVRSVCVLVCVSNALPCAWVKLENFILQSQYLPGSSSRSRRGST